MDKLKIVKIVVGLLTFLIIFGTLLLMGMIYQKTRTPRNLPQASVNLNQPQGTSIEDFKTGTNQIYLLLKGGGIPDRIAIYDLSASKISAVIHVNQ